MKGCAAEVSIYWTLLESFYHGEYDKISSEDLFSLCNTYQLTPLRMKRLFAQFVREHYLEKTQEGYTVLEKARSEIVPDRLLQRSMEMWLDEVTSLGFRIEEMIPLLEVKAKEASHGHVQG